MIVIPPVVGLARAAAATAGAVAQKVRPPVWPGITLAQLRTLAPRLAVAKAEAYVAPMNAALMEFGVTTPVRGAAWLGQMLHESVQFTAWQEYADGWDYDPSRNPTKAAKLGNTQTGDGPKYKGRGPIQLTGKSNYIRIGKALGLPLETQPDLLLQPKHGFRAAVLFWREGSTVDLSTLADVETLESFREITRRINGGYNGLDDRVRYWESARNVLGLEAHA